MARDFTVRARIVAEDAASREVEQVRSRFGRLGDFLRRNLVVSFAAVAGAVAGVVTAFRSAVSAAQEQEEAVRALDAALAGLGPAAESVSEALQQQAAALQQTTRFGDEAIIQQQALLATLGVQADQIPQATRATVDLAEALGISLESAARNVGRTVGGFAGELGELVPELKELSTEALRSGEGIELLAERFEGRAAAAADTFRGRVSQVRNAFSDLLETLGESIIENERITRSLEAVRDVLTSGGFVDAVERLAEGFARLTSFTIDATRAYADYVRGLGAVVERTVDLLRETRGLATVFRAVEDSLGAVGRALGLVLTPITETIGAIRELGRQQRLQAEAAEATAEQQERMSQAFEQSVGALLSAGSAAGSARREFEALAESQGDAVEESDDFLAAMERLGVTLESQVNAQIAENNRQLERADELLRRGEITRRDFEQIQRRIAEANREATESLEAQGDALERTASGYDAVTDGANRYGDSIERQTGRLRDFTQEQQRANEAIERGPFGSASSLFEPESPFFVRDEAGRLVPASRARGQTTRRL